MASLTVSLTVVILLFESGCSTKTRKYTAKEAVTALQAQSGQIKTERGRAWVSAKTPEQSISFPAIVVMDRTDAKKPGLRIEAMDPLGSTHALIILEAGKKLTWLDFDNQDTFKVTGSWYGLPVSQLPDLLLGISEIPEDGSVSSADAEGFEIRSGANTFRYLMSWIDPGPRLALSGVEGKVIRQPKKKSETYQVVYSKYMDKADFYLPQEVEVRGGTELEIKLAWRERTWNESVSPELFKVPSNPF